MRIAMIIEAWTPIWGGGQAHVLELSKKLAENHGCEIDIYTMNLEGANKKTETYANGKVSVIRTGKKRNFFSFIERMFWIPEVISAIKTKHQKKKYSLIHAHANLPGIPGKILSKILRIPVIYTVHGSGINSIYDMYGKNVKSYLLAKLEQFLHTGARYDYEISVDRLILNKRNVNKHIAIIPNGVNIEDFDHEVNRAIADKLRFIFVGRLHPQKGLSYLFHAIAKSIADIPAETEFHIIGTGSLKESLEKLCDDLKIQDFVRFRGEITGQSLRSEYKSSDIFLLPSLYEGQPLTLLEAWAARIPVVVTDVGGNSCMVENGINGFIIPPKDVDALAEVLRNIFRTKKSDLKQMGLSGYTKTRDFYTWTSAAKSTYEIYSSLI